MAGQGALLALVPVGRGPVLSSAGGRRFQPDIFCARGLEIHLSVRGGGEPAVLIGEQVVEAGLDRRPRDVEPQSRALTGERLGLQEPSCA